MEGEISNIIKVCFSTASSLCYCYFVSSKIPTGKPRLISLLPVIVLFVFLPLVLSYLFPIAIATLIISWLANFKLLLFAFNHGPLADDPSMSLMQFIAIASLPLCVRSSPSSRAPKLPLNWPAKVLLFAIFVGVHDYYKHHAHQSLVVVGYCCMVYLLVDIVLGAGNCILRAVSNMELEPASDEPYLSTSLQEFWGRRWNLTVTNTLRHTVYKPLRNVLSGSLGQWAPILAVLAAFLVSGLMHELLFYYATRASPTWEITCFFLLHGVCLVVENGLRRAMKDRFQLHWMVSMPLTVGFVMTTAAWLFFPPLVRSGGTDRAIEECKLMLNFVKGGLDLRRRS